MQKIMKRSNLVLKFLKQSSLSSMLVSRALSAKPLYAIPNKVNMATSLNNLVSKSYFANQVVKVPPLPDSITSGTIQEICIQAGSGVEEDDVVINLETDKVEVAIRAGHTGVLQKIYKEQGDNVEVGESVFEVNVDAKAEKKAQPTAQAETKTPPPPAQQAKNYEVKELKKQAPKASPPPTQKQPPKAPASSPVSTSLQGTRTEKRVKMSRLRQTVARRLKDSQNTAALLTTFQQCDMSQLMKMRKALGDEFLKKHGVKLGFMSMFIKASVQALKSQPTVNAYIDDNDIVYRDYVDISVAVAAPQGLLVPVIRNCDSLSFADIEKTLLQLAKKGREGKISMEQMTGGTFTISNGGVYGSLMGTPIINPPQSAILGMHGINNKPVVVGDKIQARPIMYLALTYDHRIIDGREAVLFLRKIKDSVQDPKRVLLDL